MASFRKQACRKEDNHWIAESNLTLLCHAKWIFDKEQSRAYSSTASHGMAYLFEKHLLNIFIEYPQCTSASVISFPLILKTYIYGLIYSPAFIKAEARVQRNQGERAKVTQKICGWQNRSCVFRLPQIPNGDFL